MFCFFFVYLTFRSLLFCWPETFCLIVFEKPPSFLHSFIFPNLIPSFYLPPLALCFPFPPPFVLPRFFPFLASLTFPSLIALSFPSYPSPDDIAGPQPGPFLVSVMGASLQSLPLPLPPPPPPSHATIQHSLSLNGKTCQESLVKE